MVGLEGLTKNLARQVDLCSRCGFCRAVCPVFGATLRPALGARGKLHILKEILAGRVELNQELAGIFHQCTLCGSCAATCPVGVDPSEIILAARERAVKAGLRPDYLEVQSRNIQTADNPFGLDRTRRTELVPDRLLDQDRPEVALWTGCLEAFQDVRILPAVIRILDRAGVRAAVFEGGGVCCGYPLLLAGDREGFWIQARKTARLLGRSRAGTVLTACPGCLRAFRSFYPQEGLELPRIVHLSQWLVGPVGEGRLQFNPRNRALRAVYHDPCDLGRHLGIFDPPRQVLGVLPGLELLEFAANRERGGCCGGGGGLKATEIRLSRTVAQEKVLEARTLGAEAIITACPSCKQSLREAGAGLKKAGRIEKRLKVLDLAEAVAGQLA